MLPGAWQYVNCESSYGPFHLFHGYGDSTTGDSRRLFGDRWSGTSFGHSAGEPLGPCCDRSSSLLSVTSSVDVDVDRRYVADLELAVASRRPSRAYAWTIGPDQARRADTALKALRHDSARTGEDVQASSARSVAVFPSANPVPGRGAFGALAAAFGLNICSEMSLGCDFGMRHRGGEAACLERSHDLGVNSFEGEHGFTDALGIRK
jgi:hypothetical protein